MRKENRTQNVVIAILAVTVLIMTVGYASFVRTLNINNSTATFEKVKWDVKFDRASFSETSTIHATSTDVSDTSIMFNVTLPKPGDYYSFQIKALNAGTIDAELTKITMSTLTAEQAKFVKYTVTYDGVNYTETTDGLSEVLEPEQSRVLTVKVEYVLPENHEDLPTQNDVVVNLSAALDYQDAL